MRNIRLLVLTFALTACAGARPKAPELRSAEQEAEMLRAVERDYLLSCSASWVFAWPEGKGDKWQMNSILTFSPDALATNVRGKFLQFPGAIYKDVLLPEVQYSAETSYASKSGPPVEYKVKVAVVVSINSSQERPYAFTSRALVTDAKTKAVVADFGSTGFFPDLAGAEMNMSQYFAHESFGQRDFYGELSREAKAKLPKGLHAAHVGCNLAKKE